MDARTRQAIQSLLEQCFDHADEDLTPRQLTTVLNNIITANKALNPEAIQVTNHSILGFLAGPTQTPDSFLDQLTKL
ncbi:MAG: hypothetical protein ACRCX2_13940 [Paraclostridium sp.]